jgi:oligopeptide transport system permease protein
MLRFIISRILQGLVVVFAVITLTFVLLRQAPGGPFSGERAGSVVAQEKLREHYGLDKPMSTQLGLHLWKYLTLNPGLSDRIKGMEVTEIIAASFPVSVAFGLPALLIAIGLGVPLGALAAMRPGSIEDKATMAFTTLGICAPSLVLGPIIALVFGLKLGWFNVGGWYDADDWVLPSTTLGLIYAAYVARLTQSGLRETLAQDYIRTARAKGVGEKAVVFRHALRLACLPLLNFLGPAAAGLMTGSFVTEIVFQIPGLGQQFVNAATNRDYALASATAAFYAAIIVAFNLIVDLLQAAMNPRITLKA